VHEMVYRLKFIPASRSHFRITWIRRIHALGGATERRIDGLRTRVYGFHEFLTFG